MTHNMILWRVQVLPYLTAHVRPGRQLMCTVKQTVCLAAVCLVFVVVLQGATEVVAGGTYPPTVLGSTVQQHSSRDVSSQAVASIHARTTGTHLLLKLSRKNVRYSTSISSIRAPSNNLWQDWAAGLRRLLYGRGSSDQGPWGDLRGSRDERRDMMKDRGATQAVAVTNTAGPDKDDSPGDPFTAYSTEQSTLTAPAGAYYDDAGDQVLALDPEIGVWGRSWSATHHDHPRRGRNSDLARPKFVRQNPQVSTTTNRNTTPSSAWQNLMEWIGMEPEATNQLTEVQHFKLEASAQRGVQVLAGTFEGARSAAGSGSSFNLATKDSLGGSAAAHNNDAYGPTTGHATVVANGDRRSTAFTNLAPNAAAHAGTGYGTMASSAGWEVASTARSGNDPKVDSTVTIGHRERADNGLLSSNTASDGTGRRRLRHKLRGKLG